MPWRGFAPMAGWGRDCCIGAAGLGLVSGMVGLNTGSTAERALGVAWRLHFGRGVAWKGRACEASRA